MNHTTLHAAPDYKTETLKWRMEREERLKQPTGWLSLVGLHWLKVGSQTLGCGEDNRIKLPKGACPERIGNIELTKDNVVLLHIDKGVNILIGDSNAPDNSSQKINTSDEKPDVIKAGRLQFTIIKRSKGFGIRVKDPEAATLKKFKGLLWYEYDPSWLVQAKFIKHDSVKTIKVPNILGGTDDSQSSGSVVFERLGKTHQLLALDEGDDLFIIFKDKTAGKTTYPAGRFLYAKRPTSTDETVSVDFNRAYNPPCSFTPFATCPLPPKENHLAIEIPVGEKYKGH